MSRIFRRLRKITINKSKFQKYFVYAIGEIALIIIGILIALNLNNRNLAHDKKSNFNSALSQINTNLYCEYGWYEFVLNGLKKQRNLAQLEFTGEHQVEGKEIPYTLLLLNSDFVFYETSSPQILNHIQENISLSNETYLVNQINSYYSIWSEWDKFYKSQQLRFLDKLFKEYDFTYYPSLDIYNEVTNAQYISKITPDEVELAIEIRKDKKYKTIVKSIINKLDYFINGIDYRLNETKALIEHLNNENSELELNFKNVGLIGSATPQGWNKSIPMELIDSKKSIWRIRIELEDGEIKFRNGNSWNQNWGGTDLFDGNVIFFGTHIPVKKGYYEIKLDITDKKYSIKKLL